ALGGLPSDITGHVEDALGPTGAKLVGVGVVREPVDVNGLAGDLAKTRFSDLRTNSDALTELGTGLGRQLVIGGTLPEVVRGQLFSRASGSFGGLDGVIVVRDQPEDMGPVQRSRASQFESALMGGMTATRVPAVGIEATTTEPSSVSFFQSNDLSSVDDVDLTAGQLALVFGMLGTEGSFGVKGSADRLLPELLPEAR
ncbi:MAG TPA: copper transporter, partial [Solirubrobacterales bacterium]|nr:copper transporter [Solirubrobacterales bacterium]